METNWSGVIAPADCTCVLGNPPFGGAKVQSPEQREQVRRVAGLGGNGGTLDYVAAWFIKAGDYLRSSPAKIGSVATNSITQGEQVAQLWPIVFDRYALEISFAHRTFAWGSDARGVAHVHVVIIGLCRRADEPADKRLFSYSDIQGDPTESRPAAISPYLFDASHLADRHLVVDETTTPVFPVPKIVFGNMPNDGGHLLLSPEERAAALAAEPE